MKLDKNNRRALVTAIIASGLDDFNVMFLAFSMSSIIADLGISATQAGWIGTITNFGMLAGGLVFGVLADRHNKFNVFKWTVTIFTLATGFIFFAHNIYLLYILRFIAGVGVGGEYGVAISIMAGIVPPSKMGRMSSINGIVGQVGSISSAILAGFITPLFGWRGLFLLGFAPILLMIWAHFAIDEDNILERDIEAVVTSKEPGKISDLFATKELTRQTLSLMVMTTVQIAGYFGMMNWLPTIMQEQIGVSVKDSSQWMVFTIIGMCIGMVVFGQLIDRVGPRLSYSLFLIMSAVSVYLFAFASSAWQMLLGGAIVGFFVNGMFCGYGAITTRLYPYSVRTIANNTILNVGRALGGFSSVIIGMILDNSSVSTVMFFLASLYIVSFIVMLSIPSLKAKNYNALSDNRVYA